MSGIYADGIFITFKTFNSLPKHIRDDLVAHLGQQDQPDDDVDYLKFSPSQCRLFLSRCHARTRKAIEVIAASKTNRFRLKDIAKKLDVEPNELGGVWSGLTQIARNIAGDANKTTYLIYWPEDPVMEDGVMVDQIGEVTEMTHKSFREALNL